MALRVNPNDLVAVRLAQGPDWPGIVARVWEAGAALLPIDERLPYAAAGRLITRARPTVIADAEGMHRASGGHPKESDVALVIATSGVVAGPKLVELSRSAVETAVAGSMSALDATRNEPWLSCLPLAHIGGLLVVLRSVLTGAPLMIHRRFDPQAIAAEKDVAFISVVPTMLARLVEAQVDLARFRAILVGGAALPMKALGRAALLGSRLAGTRIVETYGLTESCGGVVYGGRPFPGTEARLGDGDEIELRGPTLMNGYRFDPQATAAAHTEDGWLRTGDGGSVSADGYVRIDGRLDDVIITGGEKVHPEEVEAVLANLPSIADVGVAGRPDLDWGQRVVAFVIPTDRAAPPTLDELRDAVVRGHLPRYEAPLELVIVEQIPRTASGKIRRTALG